MNLVSPGQSRATRGLSLHPPEGAFTQGVLYREPSAHELS